MADDPKQMRTDLGQLSRQSGMGDVYASMQNAFWGINHRGTGNPISANAEHTGLTFFTRPLLNLTYHNALADRRLHPYLTEDIVSIKRAIRAVLDPWSNIGRGLNVGDNLPQESQQKIDSPLIDSNSPFITILSNTLMSLSGWPDVTVDTYTSTEGLMKEAWSMVDGVSKNYSTFDLTANFRNVAGDPITLLFHAWITYMTQVYAGQLVPYPEMILRNEIDYQTRIYRLTLDPTRMYVQKIMACGAAFPTANPLGAAANFNSERPVSEENSQISVNFRCMGAEYNDPVSILEFNRIVSIFDPLMRTEVDDDPQGVKQGLDLDDTVVRGAALGKYAKIDTTQMQKMNYRGRPRINPMTLELEWYAPIDEF
jgi:hypothetical protein